MLSIRSVVGGFRMHKFNPEREQNPNIIENCFFSTGD